MKPFPPFPALQYIPFGTPAVGFVKFNATPLPDLGVSTLQVNTVTYTYGPDFPRTLATSLTQQNVAYNAIATAAAFADLINADPANQTTQSSKNPITSGCWAQAFGDTVLLVAQVPGIGGNSYALSTNTTAFTVTGFSGGLDSPGLLVQGSSATNNVPGNPVVVGGVGNNGDSNIVEPLAVDFNLGPQQGSNAYALLVSVVAAAPAAPIVPTTVASAAYEASHVLRNSAGRLFTLNGYNSKATTQFIQLHDASSVPANTAVPIAVITVPASSNFSIDFATLGLSFAVGLVVCNSSTGPTKTIGSADCYFTASVL